jgi:hypothetical protein
LSEGFLSPIQHGAFHVKSLYPRRQCLNPCNAPRWQVKRISSNPGRAGALNGTPRWTPGVRHCPDDITDKAGQSHQAPFYANGCTPALCKSWLTPV